MVSSINANALLSALPASDRARIDHLCEKVELAQDQLLVETGEPISNVYFPLDSFILLLTAADGHNALGVGLIGNEGILGASLAFGVEVSPFRAIVQGEGSALRMSTADFKRVLDESPALERRIRQQLFLTLSQTASTAACAVGHLVDVRLACWLLMIHDRVDADRFYLTHDRIARMLGVRRSGVTTAAGVLQRRKLIAYTRGGIAILNRAGLEMASCGCYRKGRALSRQIGVTAPAGDLAINTALTLYRAEGSWHGRPYDPSAARLTGGRPRAVLLTWTA